MKKILIAEDNNAVRELISKSFRSAGFEVTEAANGEEALKQLVSPKVNYDLLLLDLAMPQIDGFQVLKHLKIMKKEKKPLVLAMSAVFTSFENISRIRELGAAGFISKTSSVSEILYRVNQFLNPGESELRVSPRTVVSILVGYRIDDVYRTAYSFNIAEGGIFLRLLKPMEMGAQLHLRFNLPGSRELIKVDGTVVWRNEYKTTGPKLYPPGVGIKFTNLQLKDKKKLHDFVEEIQKNSTWGTK